MSTGLATAGGASLRVLVYSRPRLIEDGGPEVMHRRERFAAVI
jgi:hypothetical protein